MTVGTASRKLLGPLFPIAGNLYRRAFVDLRDVAACIPQLGDNARLLDVGGGDGALLNPLLDRQPDLRVVVVDLATDIGSALRPDLAHRVELLPGTSVRDYLATDPPKFDAALLSDVIHHVPPAERPALLAEVISALKPSGWMLLIKELVPSGPRSAAAFWADRNISGDRGVSPISPVELVDLVRSVHPTVGLRTTPLIDLDHPNYMLVFSGP